MNGPVPEPCYVSPSYFRGRSLEFGGETLSGLGQRLQSVDCCVPDVASDRKFSFPDRAVLWSRFDTSAMCFR
jgi:hypothetical protein